MASAPGFTSSQIQVTYSADAFSCINLQLSLWQPPNVHSGHHTGSPSLRPGKFLMLPPLFFDAWISDLVSAFLPCSGSNIALTFLCVLVFGFLTP